nr:MAG TPA: hypothetical protein [Crassvirales sp.]
MGNNRRKKFKDSMSEKSKELVDALERLFSNVPNPDWLTKQ